jgi:hypothetical protein
VKRFQSPIAIAPLRPLTLRAGSEPGSPRYLSAASGLIAAGHEWCVIADDELHLGCFAMQGGRPGRLLRLFPGELPAAPRRRKKQKPDLEVLLRLDPGAGMQQGALLALGSGSRAQRCLGVLLPLDKASRPTRQPQSVDASPLYSTLAREFGEVNIEGGWTHGGNLYLLQRGNRGNAPNAIIGWTLDPLLRALEHDQVLPAQAPRVLREMPLGSVDGVTIGFTDGTPLPDGRWLFSAVAEDTDDAYHDGRLAGAFIGMAGSRHGLHGLRRIAPDYKVEGIALDAGSKAGRLLLVSDADDRARPAWLLEASLDSF